MVIKVFMAVNKKKKKFMFRLLIYKNKDTFQKKNLKK